MILSTGRGYVFIHIPKTGGTSMALALEDRAMKDDIMLGDTPKASRRRRRVERDKARGRMWKHSTMSDIEGLVPNDVLDGLFAFTLVRNPWDRMVSYYYWLREERFEHHAIKLAKTLPFKEFVMHPNTAATFRLWPSESYMRRSDGREQCALYIRLEEFETDAALLFDHLGFRLQLPVSNESDRRPEYRSYYDDDSAAAVAEFCALDIKRFGYQFDANS